MTHFQSNNKPNYNLLSCAVVEYKHTHEAHVLWCGHIFLREIFNTGCVLKMLMLYITRAICEWYYSV